MAASRPDATRLVDLAIQLNASPALRRIGSLVDCLELPVLAGKLEPLAPPNWDLDLDPGLRESSGAFRDSKWHIRWPVNPRAVAQEVAQ